MKRLLHYMLLGSLMLLASCVPTANQNVSSQVVADAPSGPLALQQGIDLEGTALDSKEVEKWFIKIEKLEKRSSSWAYTMVDELADNGTAYISEILYAPNDNVIAASIMPIRSSKSPRFCLFEGKIDAKQTQFSGRFLIGSLQDFRNFVSAKDYSKFGTCKITIR